MILKIYWEKWRVKKKIDSTLEWSWRVNFIWEALIGKYLQYTFQPFMKYYLYYSLGVKRI